MGLRCLLLCVAILAIPACSTTTSTRTVESGQVMSAQAAFARGDYEQAARSWQQDALETGPRQAGGMRVRAADAWLLAGKPGNAEDALRWVERKQLSPQDESRLDLVLADLALRNRRPDEAELLLRNAKSNLPDSSKSRYDKLYSSLVGQLSIPGIAQHFECSEAG